MEAAPPRTRSTAEKISSRNDYFSFKHKYNSNVLRCSYLGSPQHFHAISDVGVRSDHVGHHLLAQLLVVHADLVGTHRGQLGSLFETARKVLRSLLDALHLDVAAQALVLELLLKLGTHLGLLESELLLAVLVGLDFELGVHLSLDALPIFLDA